MVIWPAGAMLSGTCHLMYSLFSMIKTADNGGRIANTGNRILKIEVVGYIVLAALVLALFGLFAVVFSVKVALAVFASVLILAAALIAVAALIPFDYEKAALRQSESVMLVAYLMKTIFVDTLRK
jgi:hypothetical protein